MSTPTIDGLFCEEDLVLPQGFRPYTPPGVDKPIKIPTRIKAFRPLHEKSINQLKPIFDTFFEETRAAAAKKNSILIQPSIPAEPAPAFPHAPMPVDDPTDKVAPGVDDVFIVVDDRRQFLNLQEHDADKGIYVALDGSHDGAQPLLAKEGSKTPIYTDADGFELPEKPTMLKKLGSKLGNSDHLAGKEDDFIVYTKEGIPIGNFDTVAVGRPPAEGRSKRGVRALGIATVALGAVLLTGFVGGTFIGRSAVPAAGQITATEAQAYNLNQFPVDAGASFAQHYLTLCLTHPQYREDIETREEMMAGMAASGVAENCGWEQGGAVTAPTSVVFNGDVEERHEYTSGKVAYLGFFVTMSDGRHFTATVPVWAGDNGEGRSAYSIVGSVGMTAATALAGSPEMSSGLYQDRTLASQLTPTLETFFKAWADSNTQELDALVATSATGDVRVGLDGTVQQPAVNSVTVYPSIAPTEISGSTATYNYVDGDSVTAMVNLTWTVKDEAGGYQQPVGYRVKMTREAGKWVVSGIQSGAVVADGSSNGSGAAQQSVGATVSGGFGDVSNAEGAGAAG